jgi:D-glycero-alpha-D-manno-heptose-7-phosphate kinase
MIIVRSPLRISLGGGGTDLASYYEEHEGFLLGAAIDKYVYVNVTRPFTEGIFLKYSQMEHVDQIKEVRHPIIRESLSLLNFKTPQIEITTLADIPSGTGLGSSGSFTTALLKALHAHRRRHLNSEELAALACHVEIDLLKEPIGKQDQYIAAIGGVTCFTFQKDHNVVVKPLGIDVPTMHELEDNLLLFFTGYSRSASSILKDQKEKSISNDDEMLKNLHFVKKIGIQSKLALENGDINLFGELMHEHWENKKRRSSGMSNPKIDEWYNIALKNGASGGKLVGAGGGGFLMFMAHDRKKLRRAMSDQKLEEVRFKFDFEGTKILASS